MDCVNSIVTWLAERTVAHIGRQLGYLFHYTKIINEYGKLREELVIARDRVQRIVDDAISRGYKPERDVSSWLEKAARHTSQENDSDSNSSCFNLVQRHQQSRNAEKLMEEISKIIEKGEAFNTIDKVGHPVPFSAPMPQNYQFLESRTLMAKRIKDALENPHFNKVGVHGMGGVGKTYLLKEVQKLVMEEKSVFDQVIKVEIGQTLVVEDIQKQIEDKLRLEPWERAETKQGKADVLRTKLGTGNKILLVLDDLWNQLNLDDVGIPCRSNSSEKGCKILMTSRKKYVLSKDMEAECCIPIEPLDEDESWKIFVEIIGQTSNTDMEHIAKKVAKECGGLPLALVIVAKTLKGEADLQIWNYTLRALKIPQVALIEGVTDKLYSSLKLSYKHLKSEEAQSLFLLCSVFPDDYEICVEDLQMYAMGMGLLNQANTWVVARDTVTTLVGNLISSSLLLEADNKSSNKYVKMHDVVRDVAIHIALTEANMPTWSYICNLSEWPEEDRKGSYNAVFCDCRKLLNLPEKLLFQNLELLIMHSVGVNLEVDAYTETSYTFLEGMEKLKVLDLSLLHYHHTKMCFSHTSGKNLRVLLLRYGSFTNIDMIGELKELQVLRITDSQIQYLPESMSHLTELKVLEVSGCHSLYAIPPKIFSSLKKLEELNLWFWRWGKEVQHRNKLMKNATLSELKNLPCLISLRLQTLALDASMLQDLLFLQNLELENFYFNIGEYPEDINSQRAILLKISKVDLINQVFGTLWQRCEDLRIDALRSTDNFVFKSNEEGRPSPSLSQENPKHDIPFFNNEVIFPKLKYLTVHGGGKIKFVWHDHDLFARSFCQLESIVFHQLNNSRYIFSLNVAKALDSLKILIITNCQLVERIFEMEEPFQSVQALSNREENSCTQPCPNLKMLHLYCLPKLMHVWKNNDGVTLTFDNFRTLKVDGCHKLMNLLSFSTATSLVAMKVRDCREMTCIFGYKEEDNNEIVFNKLKYLTISTLPRLVRFQSGRCKLMFPCLKELIVDECPKMNKFCDGIISTPKLQLLKINGSEMVSTKHNMNDTFLYHSLGLRLEEVYTGIGGIPWSIMSDDSDILDDE